MKNECSIIRDLLPLYVEELVSEETGTYIEEHLRTCAECKTELAKLKEGASSAKRAMNSSWKRPRISSLYFWKTKK